MNTTFKEYLPRLLKSRMFFFYAGIVLILAIALFGFSGTLLLSYQEAEANQKKIAEIESFLAKFSEQKNFLESISERPIKLEEIDDIQTAIFKDIKRYRLNLVRFNAKPAIGEDKQSRDFEMTITGDYSAVMEFLRDFKAGNALLSMKYLNLSRSQGLMQAELTYTVYVR